MGDQRFIMWKKKWFYVVDLKKNDFYYIYILHYGVRIGNI